MRLHHILPVCCVGFSGLALHADQLTVSIDGFANPEAFFITEGNQLGLRVAELVPTAGQNASTHILIEGLSPLEQGTQNYASTYSGINVDTGATQDVGVLYLTMPVEANLPEGTVASPIVGVVQRTGDWSAFNLSYPATSVGGSSGPGVYDASSMAMTLERSSGAESFTGTAGITVIDEDTIELGAFTLLKDGASSYDLSGATLMRDGGRFYGTLTNLSAGAPYDSLLYSIELSNIPDVDSDGIPDISDPAIDAANPFITWMNQAGCTHHTVQFDNTKALTEAQQHWSYSLKAFYQDPAITPFIYMFELGAWVYIGWDQPGSSMCGVWAYGFDFPKAGSTADGTGTWFYLNIGVFAGEVATGAAIIDGWLYLNGGSFNDWYKLKEFPAAGEPGTYLYQGATSFRLTTN